MNFIKWDYFFKCKRDIYLSHQTTKDYRVLVKVYDELKLGDNEFNIKILYQNKPLDKVNVNLKVYKPNGEVSGYTDNYFLVFTKGSDELLGKFVNVKITSATRTSLKGEIVE